MSAVKKRELISVEDYLAGELRSQVKHEYLGGTVYAMAGARNVHNIIATNLIVSLGARLQGKPCQPFNSDTKIRVRLPTHHRFYYPDASVICRPNPKAIPSRMNQQLFSRFSPTPRGGSTRGKSETPTSRFLRSRFSPS